MKQRGEGMNILKILTPERRTGNIGERGAVRFLKRKGYKILETNYVTGGAEIDIIASKDATTAFIEVKARNIKTLERTNDRPASAVTPEKQRKIIKAANAYSRSHPSDTRLRLDVIEVYLEDTPFGARIKEIKHLEGAFNYNSAFDKAYFYKRKKEGSNL